MSDPRIAQRANRAQWLRVRATVRALAMSLVAAEYSLRRDALASDDPAMATLVLQLASERQALETLGCELDARIATVNRDCDAIEALVVEAIVGSTQSTQRNRS